MPNLNVILRVIHIFSGVAWLGGSLLMHSFVGPTAKALGSDAAAFMKHLTQKTKYVPFFGAVAILSPLSGLWLYWRQFNGTIDISSMAGTNLTIGGVFGLWAMYNGFFKIKKNGDNVTALGKTIGMAGGPPTPEQMQEMAGYQENISKGLALGTVLLSVALLFMSISETPHY